jgi:hypothetical protein
MLEEMECPHCQGTGNHPAKKRWSGLPESCEANCHNGRMLTDDSYEQLYTLMHWVRRELRLDFESFEPRHDD